jgi:hypothetical protein
MSFLPGRSCAMVCALVVAVVVGFSAGSAWADNPSSQGPLGGLEPAERHFDRFDVADKTVYFHQRTLDGAIVERDYINYQFDAASGALLSRRAHWRDDLPEHLPQAVVSQAEAEALAGGEVQWARLYVISPESAVLPIRPVPQDPCWVVRSAEGEAIKITVIDAVTGDLLGYGVPPPYTAFSFTGPWECPGSGSWYSWSQNAQSWFNTMGYSTEGFVGPTLEQIKGHVKSDETAMFFEIAHGGYSSFNYACEDGSWMSLPSFKVGVWIGSFAKMPFAFIASCEGLCQTGSGTFSGSFRKDSFENTATVGYCGMSETWCSDCWGWSLDWQNSLFSYMNQGWTVKDAFDQANADYPTCWTNDCMRFAGDEAFAVVPVVTRDPEPPAVAVVSPNGGETLDYGTQYEIRWVAQDNARVTSVTLLLSTDGGVSFPDTIAAGEANDSSFLWSVPDLSSHTARVRVVALDGVPNEGADVSDGDFTLWGTTAGVAVTPYVGVPDDVVLEVTGANPARSGWRLMYGVPGGSHVRLGVYDVGGRLVERIVDARREGGYYRADWNPDYSNAPVGPGVYFLRLDCEAGTATAKAVVAR